MGLFNRKRKRNESKKTKRNMSRTDPPERGPDPRALKELSAMLGAIGSTSAQDDVRKARNAAEKRDWKEALKYYDKAIQHRSSSDKLIEEGGCSISGPTPLYILYGERGTVYTYTGDFDAALTDYCRALELKPDNVHFLDCRGLVYYQLDHYDKAIEDFSRALSFNPPSDNRKARILTNRAACYRELRDTESALQDLEAASGLCTDENLRGNIKTLTEQVLTIEKMKTRQDKGTKLTPDALSLSTKLGDEIIHILDDTRIQPISAKFNAIMDVITDSPLARSVPGSAQYTFIASMLLFRLWKMVTNAEKAQVHESVQIITTVYELIVGAILRSSEKHGVEVNIADFLTEKDHQKFYKKREKSAKKTTANLWK